MTDLLVELWCEDLPGWAQEDGAPRLAEALTEKLTAVGLLNEGEGEGAGYATTCRVAAVINNVRTKTPPREEERRGPREGAGEKAIAGFLRGAGLSSLDDAELRETPKGKFWFATIKTAERDAREVIPEVVSSALKEVRWRKSMRWDESGFRWPRPIRRYVVMLGDESLSLDDCDGLPGMKNGAGETILATGESVKIPSAGEWATTLRDHDVEPDFVQRREKYRERLLAESLTVKESLEREPEIFEYALSAVALAAENPYMIALDSFSVSDIDESFINPILGYHLRSVNPYGSGCPVYVAEKPRVMDKTWEGSVKRRVESVAEARLADASFYWKQDKKTGIDGLLNSLEKISFHSRLGNLRRRVERIATLSRQIVKLCDGDDGLAELAYLAGLYIKVDLASGSVREIPHLQGVVGAKLLEQKFKTDESLDIEGSYQSVICWTIEHQYLRVATDETQEITYSVYLATAMDTLVGLWLAEGAPSGSGDPFALRRQCLYAIEIIHDRFLNKTPRLHDLLTFALSAYEKETDIDTSGAYEELTRFFYERLEVYLINQGMPYDIARAAIHGSLSQQSGDIRLIVEVADELKGLIQSETGEDLVTAYKRAHGLAQEGKRLKDGQPDILAEPQAIDLRTQITEMQKQLRQDTLTPKEQIRLLASAREPIDAFLDNIRVLDGPEEQQAAKVALLQSFVDTVRQIADLDHIEGGDLKARG
ncbi:MAG: glycine--tRNA ligase subunit beta [Alphaproteobacteria bacterium]|nr:glycine--tRNA ligase subunit beta [Alphaproteobacteria bacterium]MDA8003511.1 glycine--tRNA ligase subunit beta [Alphaproteobacteria bacterium]MDA8005506.1 glycine--tRNA ligase subunit beta [Alphaproteobacteria bacterium]MDA8013770.1 glycine--tRNA ligase subunit beta [Alphaproteobacteria bacterium]